MKMQWAKRDDDSSSIKSGDLASLLQFMDMKSDGAFFGFYNEETNAYFMWVGGIKGYRDAVIEKSQYAKLDKAQRKMLIHYLTGNVEKTKWKDGNTFWDASWDKE